MKVKELKWRNHKIREHERWECDSPSRWFQPFIIYEMPNETRYLIKKGEDKKNCKKFILYEYTDDDWGYSELGLFSSLEDAKKYAQEYLEKMVKECIEED